MSARFVSRGEAEASLRKLQKADGLLGAKCKFLKFPDMSSVVSLILRPTVFYRVARKQVGNNFSVIQTSRDIYVALRFVSRQVSVSHL
jgi:hypothetical protein